MDAFAPTPIDKLKQDLLKQLAESMGEFAEEMAHELIPIYIEDTPTQIEAIKSSLQTGQAEELREAAHALKGSSANMGFKQMVNLALKLELLGKAGLPDPSEGKTTYNQVVYEMQQIEKMVSTYYQT